MGDKLKPKAKSGPRANPRASSSAEPPASTSSGADPRPSSGSRATAGGGQKGRRDAILIHGVSEDGESMAVLRAREDRLEAGVLRTVKPGQPIEGELLKLTPRPEFPLVCDVEVELPAGAINAAGGSDLSASDRRDALGSRREGRGRPAQVATDSYRENWDAIWRKPGKKALSN